MIDYGIGLSRASWITLPRVLCHETPDETPDEWQLKMAKLMEEYDKYWDFSNLEIEVQE